MTEVKEMYKIARFIDSNNYTPNSKSYKEPKESILDCATKYAASKKMLDMRRAQSVLDNAIAHKYIEVIGDKPTGYLLRVTAGRGRQLVAKWCLIFRPGLREQTIKEYPLSKEMYLRITVLIFSCISAAIGSVATYIL